MSGKSVNLTDAEWHIMKYLWKNGPSSGKEIVAAMEEQVGWSRSTTLTLLDRLETKGVVADSKAEGKKQFFTILDHQNARLAETKSFLERVYDGSLNLMISSLTEKSSLSQSEIDELYSLLDKLERPD